MQLEEDEEGLGTGDQILVVIFFVFLRIFNPKNRKKGVINYEINEQWHIRREVRKVNVPMILLLSCSLEERHPPTRKSWDGDVDVSMEAVKRAAIQAGGFGWSLSLIMSKLDTSLPNIWFTLFSRMAIWRLLLILSSLIALVLDAFSIEPYYGTF